MTRIFRKAECPHCGAEETIIIDTRRGISQLIEAKCENCEKLFMVGVKLTASLKTQKRKESAS